MKGEDGNEIIVLRERETASLLDEDGDGNLIYHGTDPLCKQFCGLQQKAKRYHLHDLEMLIPELVCAVQGGNDDEILQSSCMLIKGGPTVPPTSREECILVFQKYCHEIERALVAFTDRKIARAWSKQDGSTRWIFAVLCPKTKFDMAHEIQRYRVALEDIFDKEEQRRRFLRFGAEKPIDKYLRAEEAGFADAVVHSAKLADAEIANECGKKAWKKGNKWTAELYWQRAREIGREAKYYSNLSFIRIVLGRFLRSYQLGYRELANDMLEQAVKDAQVAVEIDPTFQRAYQRLVEALLALGPYERAMEACRIIAKAKVAIPEKSLSPALLRLEDTTKNNARRWLPVQASSDGSTIPKTLDTAISNLRCCVVASLAVDDPLISVEEMKKLAARIVDAAWAVLGAIQLIYMRQMQWEREKAVASTIEIEMQLREVAKLIPLQLVELSDSLKQLVFSEEPWTFWGLDRLDRNCVSRLNPDANDPCNADEKDSASFLEILKRQTGGESMGVSEINTVHEMVEGRSPTSFAQDMSPNTFAALSFGVLQRIILAKDCPLSPDGSEQVINLYFAGNGNGLWAGGEFIGMCMNCASGIGTYGVPDPKRTASFMRLTGGAAAMAREIVQSQDSHAYYQEALATLSPQDWGSKTIIDIVPVVHDFICNGLDHVVSLEPKEIAPYCATILSAILDSVPETLKMFRTGIAPDFMSEYSNYTAITNVLNKTPFGVFLIRRFSRYERYFKDKGDALATKDIVSLVIRKWLKISKDKRSAYRWESFDDQIREELAHIAPVDKADFVAENSGEAKDKNSPRRSIPKAPECAFCGTKEGGGVELLSCVCRAAKYCNTACQTADRPQHREFCKKVRRFSNALERID